MKNVIYKSFFVIFTAVLCSCASVRKFSIETQKPAEITLPVSAQNVLILNNTVAQPSGYGIEQTFNDVSLKEKTDISMDSAVWTAIHVLSELMSASDFFSEISVYNDSIRFDDDWLSVSRISKAVQDEFFELENADVLITIDRLLFRLYEDVKKPKSEVYSLEKLNQVTASADVVMTCSVYLYGKPNPYKTISLTDSLVLKTTVTDDSTVVYKYLPEYMITELSIAMGKKVASYFIPTWVPDDRMIYTDYHARMKEAYGYAMAQRWEEAGSLWLGEFEQRSKAVDKAWIALNLAVADEMQNKFESAITWAEKAKQGFEKSDRERYADDIYFVNQYIATLQKRIQYNQVLDLQWGDE
jgi:hypothetical protein